MKTTARSLALALLVLTVGAGAARAATIAVAPAEVLVSPGNGKCSLREAILNTETGIDTSGGDCTPGTAGVDTITLASGSTYVLPNQDPNNEDTEVNGLPEIHYAVVIVGNGATIQRDTALFTGTPCGGSGAKFRIFYVSRYGDLTLSDVTLRNGCANSGGFGAGGAIFNRGAVHLSRVTLTNNEALRSGGAIHNDRDLFIDASTVSDNAVLSPEAGGGGITNRGSLSISASTISGNDAAGAGGGVDTGVTDLGLGSAGITNTTVSGNVAEGDGGGFFNRSLSSTITSTTIVLNRARNSTTAGTGSGIFAAEGTVSLTNSLVAQQSNGTNCFGVGLGSSNLDDDATCPGLVTTAAPMLGPLANNGGPTFTHALLAGSPAIDSGSNVSATDQRGVPRPQGTSSDIGAFETAVPGINVVKLTNGSNNDVAPGVFVPVGSTVTFTYQVTNAGSIPLSGVAVVDDNGTPGNTADNFSPTFTGGDSNTNGLLDAGETWTYTASRIATAGQYTNTAVATATSTITVPSTNVSDSDVDNHFGAAAAINVVKLTNGTNNDVAPGPFVPVGSTVTFSYVVTNPGNTPLSGVTVKDDNGTAANVADDFNATFVGGDANANGLLDVGETWSFTASRIATAGQYSNLATASGTPPAGAGAAVSDTDADNHFGATPAINVVKLTNGTDNDTAPGVFVTVGSTVTFTYVVTNPGNVPLSAVTVRDDAGTPANVADDFNATFVGGDANANGLLDVSETWTYTASRIATAGQYTNIATASGTPPAGAGPAVSDTNPDNHFGGNSGVNIVKRTNGTNNDTAPGIYVPVGSTVTFTYLVTNPGNTSLSAINVTDDNGTAGTTADDLYPAFTGGDANANGLLDPGETWNYTASRVATAGQYTNIGRVTATPPVGGPVSHSNPDNHFGAVTGIDLVARTNGTNNDVPPGPNIPYGSSASMTFTVTNPGNVALSGVIVRIDNGTPANTADDFNATFTGGDANANGLLDPGETFTFSASVNVVAGQNTIVSTASGNPPPGAGPAVSDSDPENFFGIDPASIPVFDTLLLALLGVAVAALAMMRLRA